MPPGGETQRGGCLQVTTKLVTILILQETKIRIHELSLTRNQRSNLSEFQFISIVRKQVQQLQSQEWSSKTFIHSDATIFFMVSEDEAGYIIICGL